MIKVWLGGKSSNTLKITRIVDGVAMMEGKLPNLALGTMHLQVRPHTHSHTHTHTH